MFLNVVGGILTLFKLSSRPNLEPVRTLLRARSWSGRGQLKQWLNLAVPALLFSFHNSLFGTWFCHYWLRDNFMGFPGSLAGKESTYNAGDPGFHSWVGKIPWRRDSLPTPVFLGFPGDSDSNGNHRLHATEGCSGLWRFQECWADGGAGRALWEPAEEQGPAWMDQRRPRGRQNAYAEPWRTGQNRPQNT